MSAQRWIHVDGAYNVRDLGGYPTAGGRTTRWRAFVRADCLDKLTTSAVHSLIEYGIGAVVDLRRTRETIDRPSAFANAKNVAYRHVNVIGDTELPGYGGSETDEGPTPEWISGTYRVLIDDRQEAIAAALTTLGASASSGQTVMFNCAAGTDRTGIIAALLLGIAGVSPDTIAQDYALSDKGLRQRFLAEGIPDGYHRLTQDDLARDREPDVLAPERAMALTISHLNDEYGGIESYVRHIGLGAEQIARLKTALLA